MSCRFIYIFSHLTDVTVKDQKNINQASHLIIIYLILYFTFYLSIALFKILSIQKQ